MRSASSSNESELNGLVKTHSGLLICVSGLSVGAASVLAASDPAATATDAALIDAGFAGLQCESRCYFLLPEKGTRKVSKLLRSHLLQNICWHQ